MSKHHNLKCHVAPASLIAVLALTLPGVAWADATPECNVGAGGTSTECGAAAQTTGASATAVGDTAMALDDNTVAVGAFSSADAPGATAIGSRASVDPSPSQDPNITVFAGTAIGSRATIIGDNDLAIGTFATVAAGQIGVVNNGTAVGAGAYVRADGGTALGAEATTTGTNSVAIGNHTIVRTNDSIAIGQGASVVTDGSVAIGTGARVTGANSVAIGTGSVADADDTVSVGADGAERRITHVADGVAASDAATVGQMKAGDAATLAAANDYTDTQIQTVAGDAAAAQDTADTALTNANKAQDTADTALTNAATAQDTADTALANTTYFVANADGPVPVASGANSVAIGPGASATRDGQVAIGGADATYTLAGVSSDASRAAQEGAVKLVTTDMAGNLATLDFDPQELLGYGGRIDTLEGRVDTLDGRVDSVENRVATLDGTMQRGFRRANGGIAAAMALGGTVMPPDSHLAVSFNLATYRGEQGYSAAVVSRVTDHVWVSGGYAGSTVRGSGGGRVGMTFGW